MSAAHEFSPAEGAERLDTFVASQLPGVSRTRARRLIDEGSITLDGLPAKPSTRLRAGQRVCAEVPEEPSTGDQPQRIALGVAYQDDSIIVVDKPAGLVVHPTPAQPDGTLLNALLDLCPDLPGGAGMRRGIVHRLDKDTSGLMVVAKTESAYTNLIGQLKRRDFRKTYLALVRGRIEPCRAVIESGIARDPANRQRMAVVQEGREAITRYRVVAHHDDCSLVEVKLVTGRTHQIRVHFASLAHPVVGDRTYGRGPHEIARQFLHAATLGFRHPESGRYVEFTSELPSDLSSFLETVARRGLP